MIDPAQQKKTQPARLSQDAVLCFTLDGESYAVELSRVRSVQRWKSATPVPDAPDYVKGIAQLGTCWAPLVDLRVRFALPCARYDATTVIAALHVDLPGDTRPRTVGLVVDAVSEIQTVSESSIIAPPDYFSTIDLSFIRGVAPLPDRLLILLYMDRVLPYEELRTAFEAVSEASARPHHSFVSAARNPHTT